MSKVQKMRPKIVEAIAAYLETKDISRRELATRVGVSAALITQMMSNKWDDIADAKWLQIWNYISPDNLENIVETKDFNAVMKLCRSAIDKRLMVGLLADTGMGKSTSLKTFAMRKNVFYCYIDLTVTPRTFLKNLIRDMGISFEGNINDMLLRIAKELNTLVDPLLIIDESAKLSDNMILLVHSLRDRTKGNCGIVLAGMPDFQFKLQKKVERNKTGYGEFYRRIEVWHTLGGLDSSEIKYILQTNGITDVDFREFRNYRRFGDLANEIRLYKETNEQ